MTRAAEEAVNLWALASTQYPSQNQLILAIATRTTIEVASAFALNARRACEVLPRTTKFQLKGPRWKWSPISGHVVVDDLWDALNRIIHAQKLVVGFESLPSSMAVVEGGARVIPYIQAQTDHKPMAFIDLFALSHAYLYEAYPHLSKLANDTRSSPT